MIPARDDDDNLEPLYFGGFIAAFFIGSAILWIAKLPFRCMCWVWRRLCGS